MDGQLSQGGVSEEIERQQLVTSLILSLHQLEEEVEGGVHSGKLGKVGQDSLGEARLHKNNNVTIPTKCSKRLQTCNDVDKISPISLQTTKAPQLLLRRFKRTASSSSHLVNSPCCFGSAASNADRRGR